MKFLLAVFCSVVLFVCVRSTIVPGRCPVVPVKDGFDINKYAGVWYDIRSYFAFFQVGVNCSRAEYTVLASNRVRVNNTGTTSAPNGTVRKRALLEKNISEQPRFEVILKTSREHQNTYRHHPNVHTLWRVFTNATGYATAPNPSMPAKLLVTFDYPRNSTGDYWVADTDYTTYSIVWACTNIAGGLFHEVHAWVLGRSAGGFNGNTEAVIDRSLSAHNIDPTLFFNTTQKNCVNY